MKDLELTINQGTDALLIVDVQNDFCPDGALAVTNGDEVVPFINAIVPLFTPKKVFASRDWHPPVTRHFAKDGGKWPVHCVQNTPGAAFHPDLVLPYGTTIITKGTDPQSDSYSAFDGVDEYGIRLVYLLREQGVKHLFVGGLATDYCVRETVLEALQQDFKVTVLTSACRAVDPSAGTTTLQQLVGLGVEIL